MSLNFTMDRRLVFLDRVISFSLMGFALFSFFSISLTQISCGLGGLAWMTKCHLTGTWRNQRLPLKIPFLLFILACLVAVAGAVDVEGSYKSLKRLLEILIFFWAVNCIENEDQRDRLILLFIGSATLSTLTGFYAVLQTGITIQARVEGTMSVYMTYAGLLMLALLVTLGNLIFSGKDIKANKWLLGAVVFMAFCLMLTYTRQAWLGLMAGIVFLIWFRKKILLCLLPVLMIVLFVISPVHVKQRMTSIFDFSDKNLVARLALWQGGWLVFKDHPLTGCGFKCIDAVNHLYPDPTGWIKKLRGLHNNFIQLAVDTGIFGLGSWISIWVFYFMTLFKRREPGYSRQNACLMGSSAAVFGFLAAGLFETNFYDAEVSMALYFVMALPFAGSQTSYDVRT